MVESVRIDFCPVYQSSFLTSEKGIIPPEVIFLSDIVLRKSDNSSGIHLLGATSLEFGIMDVIDYSFHDSSSEYHVESSISRIGHKIKSIWFPDDFVHKKDTESLTRDLVDKFGDLDIFYPIIGDHLPFIYIDVNQQGNTSFTYAENYSNVIFAYCDLIRKSLKLEVDRTLFTDMNRLNRLEGRLRKTSSNSNSDAFFNLVCQRQKLYQSLLTKIINS